MLPDLGSRFRVGGFLLIYGYLATSDPLARLSVGIWELYITVPVVDLLRVSSLGILEQPKLVLGLENGLELSFFLGLIGLSEL